MHNAYKDPKPNYESRSPSSTIAEQPELFTEQSAEIPDTAAEIPMSPEVAEAAAQEQEVRYQDVELLGSRYSVQRVIHENSVQAIKKAGDTLSAKYHNVLDAPGKFTRQIAHSLAESHVQRKQAKYDEISHLSDNSILKKKRLAKLQKAEGRRDQAKTRLDERTTQMKDRTESVKDNAESRKQEYITGLKSRRENALGRKALRHELRQQGAGWLESRSLTKEIIESTPKEHLARVGELATIAHAGQKFARQAERAEHKAASSELSIASRIGNVEHRMKQYSEEARNAHQTVAEIRNKHLPAAEQRVTDLEAELATMTDDDPAREVINSKLQKTLESIVVYMNREIPYWTATAKKSEQQVITLQGQRDRLKQQLRAQKESLASISETSDEKRATAEQHNSATSTEAQRIINGE